jgi:predicted nuclease of predicted toxin-antitoxin system
MNLLADEGVDLGIVEALRRAGHQVAFVAELAPGLTDDAVLVEANRTGALLLTADKDFGDLVVRQRRSVAGVILLRTAGLPAREKAALVEAVLAEHGGRLAGSFTVVTRRAVRIRRVF